MERVDHAHKGDPFTCEKCSIARQQRKKRRRSNANRKSTWKLAHWFPNESVSELKLMGRYLLTSITMIFERKKWLLIVKCLDRGK